MKERKEQQGEAAGDESVVAVLEKTDAAETSETTVATDFVISADVTTEEADGSTEPAEGVVSLVASEASENLSMEVSVSTSEAAEPESMEIGSPELSFSFTTSTDEPELDLSAELQVNAALQLTSAETTEVEEEIESPVAGEELQISADVTVDETAETMSLEVAEEEGKEVEAVIATVDSVDVEYGTKEETELKAEEDQAVAKADVEEEPKAEEARLKAEEEARLKAEEEAHLKAEEEACLKAEEEARLKAEEEARLKAEEEARIKAEEEARIKAEEEARLKVEEEARLKAEEEARLKAEEEARKPKETETDKAIKRTFVESCPAFQPIPDEFYSKLFYFSGMGTLIGSSLSAGIYVPEDTAKCGLGAEQVESCVPESFDKHVEMVKTARSHAIDLTTELRKLQALLQGLPIFTGEGAASGMQWRTQSTRHTSLSSGATTRRTRSTSYGGVSTAPLSAPPQQAPDVNSSVSALPAQRPSPATPSSGYTGGAPPSGGYGGGAPPSDGYTGGAQPSGGYNGGAPLSGGYSGGVTEGAQYPFELPGQRGRVPPPRPAPTVRDERDGSKVEAPPTPAAQSKRHGSDAVSRPPPPPVQPKPRVVVTDATAPTAAWAPRRRPWEPAPDTLDVPRRRRAHSLITPPAVPVSPVASPMGRDYGVFTGQGRSWRDKYGKAGVVDQPAPKPFGGVAVSSSGLKTWQMSRLRGLEAKGGYLVDSEQVYIDNTPARRASASAEASQIGSYSPYLVSAKSRVIDYAAKPMSPTSAKAFQPHVQNGFAGGSLAPLPYCDL